MVYTASTTAFRKELPVAASFAAAFFCFGTAPLFVDIRCDIRMSVDVCTPVFHWDTQYHLYGRIGDYPGQGEVSGMSHQGAKACHWCKGKWKKNPAFRRHCCCGHYRWLDAGDPLRTDDEEPPDARTPSGISRDGQAAEDSDLPLKDPKHPRKRSGVNCTSALSLLPMFNIVWDVLPDWMHIMKNLILPHFLKVVKGKRKLTRPIYKQVPAENGAATER